MVALFSLILSGNVYALKNDNITLFNCSNSSRVISNSHRSSDTLHYDGRVTSIISPVTIANARLDKSVYSNLGVFCSPRMAKTPQSYVEHISRNTPIKIKYISSIYFPTGSAFSSDKMVMQLDDIVMALPKEYRGLLIIGSADSTGEDDTNYSLSLARTRFLADKLDTNKHPLFLLPLGSKMLGNGPTANHPEYRRADLYAMH